MTTLNLFYSEPNFDRWVFLDRYPRALVRRLWRGPARPGGQQLVYLNLLLGLERLGVPHRRNDYRHARRHPDELCCLLGKRHVLELEPWTNPLMVGPCVFDHPIDAPDLFHRHRVRRLLVPGPWMAEMCRPAWGPAVHAWPVGIDTDRWRPEPGVAKTNDVLLYNKVRWDLARRESGLLEPIRSELSRRGLKTIELRYGSYRPEEYRAALLSSRMMIFFCEHETQGLAYQQALASGVPLLAWDHGGEWLDPMYHPHRIRFGPVSSVPYWDDRCGIRFRTAGEFPAALDLMESRLREDALAPRQYILDHLTLEKCATLFVEHAQAAARAPDYRPLPRG